MNNAYYKIAVLSATLTCSVHAFAAEGVETAPIIVAVRPSATTPEAGTVAPKADTSAAQAEKSTAPAATNGAPSESAMLRDSEAPAKGTDILKAAKAAREAKLAKAMAELPPPTAQETQAGIQIVHLGMTAASGLVDFRFKILDASKAKKLLGNPGSMPTLLVEDNPPLHPPHHAMRGIKYANGAVNYILYPNARNAIKPGVEVKVVIGDVRLGPVKVQPN